MIQSKILVVDDMRGDRLLVESILKRKGYGVQVASDGLTALQLLSAVPFDLVVLDYEMPGLNGVDTFRRARELRPGLRGVFVTAHHSVNAIFPAIDADIERVLPKPVSAPDLHCAVQSLIGPALK